MFDSMLWCPIKHTFQMLTKNPELINPKGTNPIYPKNWWFGTTVTNENQDWVNLEHIKKIDCGVRFGSFEPLLGPLPDNVSLKGLDWVIIGKLTGSKRVKIQFDWLASILDQTGDYQIPVFMKNNLRQAFPNLRLLQEYPKTVGE